MGKRIEIKHKLGGAKVCEAEEDFKDPTIQKEDFGQCVEQVVQFVVQITEILVALLKKTYCQK